MKPTNKLIPFAVAATLATGVTCANAAAVFQFDTNAVAGNTVAPFHTFLADEITTTSVGNATITQTDSSAPFGAFGAADDFVEIGLVSLVNFKNGGVDVFGSGVGSSYALYADYLLTGTAAVDMVGNIIVSITGGSGNIHYQEAGGGVILPAGDPDLGGSVQIGALTSALGDCNITAATSLSQGSCKVNFAFDAGGVSDTGVFTLGGIDLGLLGASFLLDINVDELVDTATGLAPTGTYIGFGTTCDVGMDGGGDACVANLQATHDGSGRFNVPEPGTLALLGVGLFGLGRIARRKIG